MKCELYKYQDPATSWQYYAAWISLGGCWITGAFLGHSRIGLAAGVCMMLVFAGLAPAVFRKIGTLTVARRHRPGRQRLFWSND
jgi:hypothetical protein